MKIQNRGLAAVIVLLMLGLAACDAATVDPADTTPPVVSIRIEPEERLSTGGVPGANPVAPGEGFAINLGSREIQMWVDAVDPESAISSISVHIEAEMECGTNIPGERPSYHTWTTHMMVSGDISLTPPSAGDEVASGSTLLELLSAGRLWREGGCDVLSPALVDAAPEGFELTQGQIHSISNPGSYNIRACNNSDGAVEQRCTVINGSISFENFSRTISS